jgi:Brp/Blh family beta-carotene 15,15'-monooxygenase
VRTGSHDAASRFRSVMFGGLPLACLVAAAVAGAAWGPTWSERWAPWPWLVSLAVVGLPHGAVDWAVTRRTCPVGTTRRLAIAYLLGMLVVLGLFVAIPVPLIILFAAVSVWHFGMAHADGQMPPVEGGLVRQGLAALARGGLVLAVPMACWPAETAAVAEHVVSLATPRSAGLDGGVVRGLGIALAAATLAAFAIEAMRSWPQPQSRPRTLATAAELTAFAAVGMTTKPLFSVGLYFLCWHAWRQMLLVAPVVTGSLPGDWPSLVRGLLAIHRAALPLLVPTWLVLAAVWWRVSPTHSVADLAALSLVVYLVVTPSHDLLIDLARSRAARTPEPSRSSLAHRCTALSAFWSS